MEEEIKSKFERSGFQLEDEEEILKKCLAFAPSDLISSWEVYYLNRQPIVSALHNAQMDGFLLHLENEQKDTYKRGTTIPTYLLSSNDVV